MDSGSVEAPPPPPLQGAPPPPPPPPPIGGAKIPTWREQQEAKLPAQQQIQQIQNDQYSNLPPQLMNSMSKDKKPFTYTPLAVGDKGKLDLSQIRSPRMKKRLLANMKEEDEESGAPTSESPCSYEPSPTPPPTSSHSLDRSQTPDPSRMANKSEVPKIFKVPLPPKIDFTQELLARQREKQTPVNITSTPTAASFMDTNRAPMSPVELENTVDSEILGLHNALNQARPLEDISELINTRVPSMASTHPLADARMPTTSSAKLEPQNYSNDYNGGYESSHHDGFPMASQSNGTTSAPLPPPPPAKRSSNMATIPIRYENNTYSNKNQNDPYNSSNSDNYNDYLYQPSQPQQQQNYSSNSQYGPRYDAQPVAPPREYFNIEPPKKIDILREIERQDPALYSAPTKVLGPSLGEQWAQKKQTQGQYPYEYSQPNYESYQIPYKSQPAPPPRPQPPPQYEYNPQPMRYNSQQSQPQQQYRPVNVSYDDGERSEPTQSRSFKVLQKLTEGIEDEIQNLRLHEKQMNMQQAAPQIDRNHNWQSTDYGAPRQTVQPSPRPYPRGNSSGYGTSNIPNNSIYNLQDLVSDLNTAVYGNNYQNGQSRSQKENIIPVRLEDQSFPSYASDAYRSEGPPASSRSYRMVKHRWESTQSVPYGTDF
ncbi:uncharacterized protein LOC141852240 [Brevipalpus obovatus]|uniref:uncharacterized protein LOC141852240 n=1 Tax=Brevipalpus obovatus TaxID=246614 RepID=UPI003D9E123D